MMTITVYFAYRVQRSSLHNINLILNSTVVEIRVRIGAQVTSFFFILLSGLQVTVWLIQLTQTLTFSTYDQNNDPSSQCALVYGAGWWFDMCTDANLNKPWESLRPWWYPVVNDAKDARGTLMMIRPN